MDDIRPSKEDLGNLSEMRHELRLTITIKFLQYLGSLSKSVKDIFKMFLNKKIWALLPLFAFLATYNTFIIIDFSKVPLIYIFNSCIIL